MADCVHSYKYGHSDSMSFYHPEEWSYVRVKGMGLIDALGVTHFHAEGREADFQRMVAEHPEIGIAIDNNCAIEFIGDEFRLITSQTEAKAYRLHKDGGQIVTEQIEQKQELTPISTLLER